MGQPFGLLALPRDHVSDAFGRYPGLIQRDGILQTALGEVDVLLRRCSRNQVFDLMADVDVGKDSIVVREIESSKPVGGNTISGPGQRLSFRRVIENLNTNSVARDGIW